MTELFLALIAAILLLTISWNRDPGAPFNAMLLGCLPVLLFLAAAKLISGFDWEFHSTAFWCVGLFVGLPIVLLTGAIGILLANKDSTAGTNPVTWKPVRPLALCLLLLVIYGAIALVFIPMYNDAETLTVGTGLLGVLVLVGANLLLAIYGYVLHAILLRIRK